MTPTHSERVTRDPELLWEDHVSTVIRKSYETLAGLAKFAKKLPTEVKKAHRGGTGLPPHHVLPCCMGRPGLPRPSLCPQNSSVAPLQLEVPITVRDSLSPK